MSLQIRMQADDFLQSYLVLEKNYNTASLTIMVPSVVCLSFAVELYLKDLHFVLTGKAPRGHDIYKLFEKLPSEIKQAIFSYKSISQNPFMTRGNMFSPQYYSHAYSPYNRFIDQMNAISNSFEKWRYSYESTILRYDSSFALALIESVKATADNLRSKRYGELKIQTVLGLAQSSKS